MLRKVPKRSSLVAKGVGGILIFEAALFGISYYFWKRLNNDLEYRYRARKDHPWMLSTYYKVGTLWDKHNPAEFRDQTLFEKWDAERGVTFTGNKA